MSRPDIIVVITISQGVTESFPVGFHISEMNSVPFTGPAEVRKLKLTHCFSDLIL